MSTQAEDFTMISTDNHDFNSKSGALCRGHQFIDTCIILNSMSVKIMQNYRINT